MNPVIAMLVKFLQSRFDLEVKTNKAGDIALLITTDDACEPAARIEIWGGQSLHIRWYPFLTGHDYTIQDVVYNDRQEAQEDIASYWDDEPIKKKSSVKERKAKKTNRRGQA